MTSSFSFSRAIAAVLLATVAMTGAGISLLSSVEAKVVRRAGRAEQALEPNVPLLAVVGLAEQRVTIYDATGKILQSPVSSGQTGLETPQGIFSVVQKEEDHTSNIYDDASMPFMQRVTWTGIALHAGALPGYPASHGCVRMPEEFARELYGLTKLGLRVVIARQDIAPVDIDGPDFFKPRETRGETAPGDPSATLVPDQTASVDASGSDTQPQASMPAAERRRNLMQQLGRLASTREAEAQSAIWKEQDARQAVARIIAESAPALRALKQAEANLARDEADLMAAEKALATGGPPAKIEKAERAKAQAFAGIETKRAQLQALQTQSQGKIDAVKAAEQDARSAADAVRAAAEAASDARQNMAPVSVFISRKTQRLYVRKAHMPLYETPVFIRDADAKIGSFVFTALEHDNKGEMRWNVLSLYPKAVTVEPQRPAAKNRTAAKGAEPALSDVGAAKAALERITVSEEARERISEVVLPGSSLIISDEGPSIETGKDTDFVVVMSGEPQGGIAIRQQPREQTRDNSSSRDEDTSNNNRRRTRRSSGGGGNGFSFWFD